MNLKPAGHPALHGPSRPGWICVACGDPWPCLTRKRQLRELFEGSVAAHLMRYMSPYLADAVRDLDGLSTTEVTDRIVGWCGEAPPTDRRHVTKRNRGPGW